MIKLTATEIEAINKHSLECHPNEMCGILVEEGFIPIENVSDNPLKSFRLRDLDLVPYIGKIRAVVHSHCRGARDRSIYDLRTPSAKDIKNQKVSDIPWLIVGTDGSLVLPAIEIPREKNPNYLGRPFIWFINDCYTIVQDYYKFELGIDLPDHKAEVDYKELVSLNNLFEGYIEEYNFSESTSVDNMQNGDLLLLSSPLAICNHLGIFHNGDVIHQKAMSIREPFSTFIGRINKVLRYKGSK